MYSCFYLKGARGGPLPPLLCTNPGAGHAQAEGEDGEGVHSERRVHRGHHLDQLHSAAASADQILRAGLLNFDKNQTSL